ncbi:MAG: hypothetical protein DDT30_01582 [Dehalococcoidia bacterium]|nr:hypothetical protein [Bacillota bacterium]MBT9143144.1 hypothetical protein [Bacillota bacterium]
MRKADSNISVERRILVIILVIFFINTLLLAAGLYLLNSRYAPTTEDFLLKQELAKELVDYNRRLARNMGVDTRSQVHEALSRFSYEIELATNSDALSKAILANGSSTQQRILEEYETRQREIVLSIVNQDPKVRKNNGNQTLTLQLSRDQGIQVKPAGILQEETLLRITEAIKLGELTHDLTVEIGMEEGRGRLLVPLNTLERIRVLTREHDALRVMLHELRAGAGHADLSGPGIIIRIYDASNGFTNDTIIHDTNVRDVVNELFATGAQGIAVGGQRLTVTSAIRCVGPSILVNDERIAVNPVVISAVGAPEVLSSGLDIIRITLEVSRNLNFEVEKVDNLTLPALTRR